jgi:hypothetical protein
LTLILGHLVLDAVPEERGPDGHIDLSQVITEGMVTYPGLPTPVIGTHLSREAAYGPGYTFHFGLVTMCTNTGTYLTCRSTDSPTATTSPGWRWTGWLASRRWCSIAAGPCDRPR